MSAITGEMRAAIAYEYQQWGGITNAKIYRHSAAVHLALVELLSLISDDMIKQDAIERPFIPTSKHVFVWGQDDRIRWDWTAALAVARAINDAEDAGKILSSGGSI
jgi:hypothetical protein